ncbi:2-oxo-4-hydroxy-4-carboxy-5-ureidoimidazoline decarboxylase [Rhodopila sp.]|uniref:2-oxo-4-hydroxy-4-carboxy-5-ureidoimidazoline decarboxylase n=1 Tax=Rhodopila sp. TaxID=2480087 RepID=UPI003D0BF13A
MQGIIGPGNVAPDIIGATGTPDRGTIMHTLDQLNAMPPDAFAATLDGVFEYAPWVAEAAARRRPFASVTALHEALMATVHDAPADRCLGFLRSHPALSAIALTDLTLTAASRTEQAGLAMSGLDDQIAQFEPACSSYETRFGFPFIVCVRRQTPRFVLRGLQRRLINTPDQERAAALVEIGHITRLRLVDRVHGPGMPPTSGHLSAHVLDTVRGKPAEGIRIEVWREGVLIQQAVTNQDGRTDVPLWAGAPLRIGRYELRFDVQDYCSGWPDGNDAPSSNPISSNPISLNPISSDPPGTHPTGPDPPDIDPPWHDVIPIRFGVAEPEGRYHVPLLLGGFSFTTYRGS